MKSLFHAVAVSILFSFVLFTVPSWSAQQPTVQQLAVNELAAKPDSFIGKVTVVGRVAAATPGKGFTLTDSSNCATCPTECLTDRKTENIPFLWSGAAPEVKGVVLVQGTLAKTTKGFTFTADKVEKPGRRYIMKKLHIIWQRLVDEQGRTCDRCGMTETAVGDAVEKLKRSLKELNIDVVLKKEILSPSTFRKDPLESNRIWIAGQPIEKWLSATSGQSKCCSTCGDSDCRTVTVDGKTYEAIPAELIVKAGLLAGAQLLNDESGATCCPPSEPPQKSRKCCPSSSKCQK
jgi:hypothetical protein